MSLTGAQKQKLNDALVRAYPGYKLLDMMLTHRLDQPLANLPAGERMPIVLFQVNKDAEATGRTAALIAQAVNANPGNPRLYEVAQELGMTALPSPLQRTINES